jgi:hypothetical protein
MPQLSARQSYFCEAEFFHHFVVCEKNFSRNYCPHSPFIDWNHMDPGVMAAKYGRAKTGPGNSKNMGDHPEGG